MRSRRWWVAAVAVVLGLSACTTTTLTPTDTTSSPAPTTSVSTSPEQSTQATAPGSTAATDAPSSEITPTDPTSDATTASASASEVTATPATYTPPVDAAPVDGACPYLDRDQVQSDTGQRTGTPQIRPAEPQPVCEFVRNDGNYLATVRVLQLNSDATAVAAVDHYVPRDASNPETRPSGWTGGSLATDDGSTYGVSKGTYAVIARTNQKQSVYARLLVEHAIADLGL